jgi:DNA (cytosine-5)-methyltransferase 1
VKIVSLFSGCGGLDLGFTRAGFELVYANDISPIVWETFEKNHKVPMDKRSLFAVDSKEIPDADGIIGGPPCQSWSLAGEMRGAKDERGQLFYEYVRVLRDKKPKFFLAENVPGIISKTHLPEFKRILKKFSALGYEVSFKLVDARDYGVPQARKRVIIIGYLKSLGKRFNFPQPTHSKDGGKILDDQETSKWLTLRNAIGDLPEAVQTQDKNKANESLYIPNHEYMNGAFSFIYMSRNRRRNWDDPSLTIQAGGRHAPLHPNSCKMVKIEKDVWRFEDSASFYRRVSVREAARIQTFPDDFIFCYTNAADGYTMVGNAVPVKLAEVLATKIKTDLEALNPENADFMVSI